MELIGSDTADMERFGNQMARTLVSTAGMHPIVGTPGQVVDEFARVSDLGLDGLALAWVNFEEGLDQLSRELYPLMYEAGLRTPERELTSEAGR
jgi:alkanesulfonate monooxygenase SsuD/methylene tetrahydromethanopterin reductase-like flavin-dependent oxidoreductase (luciferase family)